MLKKIVVIILVLYLINSFFVLSNTQKVTTKNKLVFIDIVVFDVNATVFKPYTNWTYLNITFVDLNDTIPENYSIDVFLKYIVLTYDFGSKFFDLNMTHCFTYANRTHYYSNKLHLGLFYPILNQGIFKLNITLCFVIVKQSTVIDTLFSLSIPIQVRITSVTLNLSIPAQNLSNSEQVGFSILLPVVGIGIVVLSTLCVFIIKSTKQRSQQR